MWSHLRWINVLVWSVAIWLNIGLLHYWAQRQLCPSSGRMPEQLSGGTPNQQKEFHDYGN